MRVIVQASVAFCRPFRHHEVGRIRLIKEFAHMTVSIGHLQPIVALLAGILILIMPRLLNYIVAIYLIVIGIIGLGLIR
jgi:hypothetical protein